MQRRSTLLESLQILIKFLLKISNPLAKVLLRELREFLIALQSKNNGRMIEVSNALKFRLESLKTKITHPDLKIIIDKLIFEFSSDAKNLAVELESSDIEMYLNLIKTETSNIFLTMRTSRSDFQKDCLNMNESNIIRDKQSQYDNNAIFHMKVERYDDAILEFRRAQTLFYKMDRKLRNNSDKNNVAKRNKNILECYFYKVHRLFFQKDYQSLFFLLIEMRDSNNFTWDEFSETYYWKLRKIVSALLSDDITSANDQFDETACFIKNINSIMPAECLNMAREFYKIKPTLSGIDRQTLFTLELNSCRISMNTAEQIFNAHVYFNAYDHFKSILKSLDWIFIRYRDIDHALPIFIEAQNLMANTRRAIARTLLQLAYEVENSEDEKALKLNYYQKALKTVRKIPPEFSNNSVDNDLIRQIEEKIKNTATRQIRSNDSYEQQLKDHSIDLEKNWPNRRTQGSQNNSMISSLRFTTDSNLNSSICNSSIFNFRHLIKTAMPRPTMPVVIDTRQKLDNKSCAIPIPFFTSKEFLYQHRHDSEELQQAYDKRYGLIVYRR